MNPVQRARRIGIRFGLGLLSVSLALGISACGNSRVTAPLPPLADITVSPAGDTVRVGESVGFVPTAYDSSGHVVSGVQFAWRSSDPSVATISVLGVATGMSEGDAKLIVTAGGLADTVTLHVTVARRGWFTQTSNVSETLHGVTFRPDGRSGWAVGATGRIVVTHDAGQHWNTQTSSTSSGLNAVWFVSDSSGFAVGAGGTVMHTENGGRTWSRQTTGTTDVVMDVCFLGESLGWAVGANGLVLRTSDAGTNWAVSHETSAGQSLNGVSFADASDGWAVGDLGVILGTHDGGVSWFTVQPAVTGQSLESVWRRSADLAWAVGMQGVAPRTIAPPADSVQWEVRNTGAGNQLYGVHFPTDLIGYAVGSNGTGAVLRTANGGTSWAAQVAPTGFQLRDVFFVDSERGWAVGDNGTVLHTGTGGLP